MKDLQIKKLYYSISEISKMVGLEQYVLRYWETEFEQLRPQKNRAGNRAYTEKDIEIIKLIKKLTREDRYTIEGARQVMGTLNWENGVPDITDAANGTNGSESQSDGPPDLLRDLRRVRSVLIELLQKIDPSTSIQ